MAAILALLTAVTVELALLFVGAAIAALTGLQRGAVMVALLFVGSLMAWAIAGAVAYEAGRRRAATIVAGLLPAAIVAALIGTAVIVRREALDGEALAAVLSALLLGLAAYAGGRLRERSIRRRGALQ